MTQTNQGTADPAHTPTQRTHQQVFQSWVPPRRVPTPHRKFVQRQLDRIGRQNGFDRIDLRWFGPAVDGGDFWGISTGPDQVPLGLALPWDRPTIAINVGLRGPAMVLSVIAHEVHHLVQMRAGVTPRRTLTAELAEQLHADCTPERCVADQLRHEADADRYAAEYVASA